MSRQYQQQKKRDDLAFPVRVRVRLPEYGSGEDIDTLLNWCRNNVPAGAYAWYPDSRNFTENLELFHFRDTETAHRFVEELNLELPDGTTCSTYSSPALPFGRKA